MAFIDDYNLANNETFRSRVLIAMEKVATQIVGEAITPGDEVKHEKRHVLGVKVLTSPNAWVMPFSYAVVSGGVLILASTDGDIEFTVVSVYDDLAGVSISD